jgi:hypothetical protein
MLVAAHDDCLDHYSIDEYWGWQIHENVIDSDGVTDAQAPGYLAREITEHDKEAG